MEVVSEVEERVVEYGVVVLGKGVDVVELWEGGVGVVEGGDIVVLEMV